MYNTVITINVINYNVRKYNYWDESVANSVTLQNLQYSRCCIFAITWKKSQQHMVRIIFSTVTLLHLKTDTAVIILHSFSHRIRIKTCILKSFLIIIL